MDSPELLRGFTPAKKFFIGIDSDGCVFDSMEVKHKECFTPMFIKHFGLQAVGKYARQTWEFVNLYSKTRGCNRYPALARSLKLLRARPEVVARHAAVPETGALEDWIGRQKTLDNHTLAAEIAGGNQVLAPILAWSKAVNAAIADIVEGVPPFPLVRESLDKMRAQADAMVISQTPTEALKREWGRASHCRHRPLDCGPGIGDEEGPHQARRRRKISRGEHPDDWRRAGRFPGRQGESSAVLSDCSRTGGSLMAAPVRGRFGPVFCRAFRGRLRSGIGGGIRWLAAGEPAVVTPGGLLVFFQARAQTWG